MKSLTTGQKNLIFDYCFGLTDQAQTIEAQSLLASSSEAEEVYSKLQSSFSILNSLPSETCPEELAEGTVFRLKNSANASQLRLKQLLEQEQSGIATARPSFWRSLAEMAAVAAVILVVAGVSFPALRSVRQTAWQTKCQAQLLQISRGFTDYASDNQGNLPAVATTSGSPWWKVGNQGNENHSNTRHLWLLVKDKYVEPDDFVCPGRTQGRAMQFDKRKVKNLLDFPDRRYVTYSFKIMCDDTSKKLPAGDRVFMSDLNPVFEKMFNAFQTSPGHHPKMVLGDKMLKLNSFNHNNRGQNIILGSGAVKFVRTRNVGPAADDIFTLKDKTTYTGTEIPYSDDDIFLAP